MNENTVKENLKIKCQEIAAIARQDTKPTDWEFEFVETPLGNIIVRLRLKDNNRMRWLGYGKNINSALRDLYDELGEALIIQARIKREAQKT